jgi:hypothetical protein
LAISEVLPEGLHTNPSDRRPHFTFEVNVGTSSPLEFRLVATELFALLMYRGINRGKPPVLMHFQNVVSMLINKISNLPYLSH